jgi:SPP1 gp7 family putative phage head morphogenesis protein
VADIYEIAARFRTTLLKRERAAASRLVRAYGAAYKAIGKDLDSLLLKITEARKAGEPVNEVWLIQQSRLTGLLDQVRVEIQKFSVVAGRAITAGQQAAITAAIPESLQLMQGALGAVGVFNRLPKETVETLVGFLSDGSPLSSLLSELVPEAEASVRTALINGVISGKGTRVIASEIKQALGGNLTRALTIARTETLRAYREASRQSYKANSDIIKGWRWHSALDTRTCAMCWAMHGTFHDLDEILNDHPNGRCAMIPETKTYAEIGIDLPDDREPMKQGIDEFAKLSKEKQREILGNSAFDAYSAGKLNLTNVVGERVDPRWGPVRYRKPLREILGSH